MFEELRNTPRVDQEQMQKTATKNKSIVVLCQQITDTNQEQGKQILK